MAFELPYDIKVPTTYDLPAKISWIASDESPITSGQMLAVLTPLDPPKDNYINDNIDHSDKKRRLTNTSKNVIKAPKLSTSATMRRNLANDSVIDSYDLIIGTITQLTCDHSVVVHGLCADCNEEIDITEDSFDIDDVVKPGFITNEASMSISATFVRQMEESNLHSLLIKRLLCLVLDLDNTLIHAKTLDKNEVLDSNDDFKAIYFGGRCNLYRLRPGVSEFLDAMSKYYQLYLFTMGTSEHATAALSLLDPQGKLFSNRIFSRSDSQNSRKTLSRIFPNYQGIVCVVDDCEHAWRADLSGAGFFKIHPYYYFSERSKQHNPLTAMITAASNQSFYNTAVKGDKICYDKNTLSSQFLDESPVDNDKMLLILGNLLINFHEKFFQKLEDSAKANNFDVGLESFKRSGVTLGTVMDQFRSQILKGVKLSFNTQDFGCDFINSDYIAWAKAFGATIVNDNDSITHKLLLNPHTTSGDTNDKTGTKDVHLMWLDKCIYTWVRGDDEELYNPSLWTKPYRNFWDLSAGSG
ncbi:RNA polymerase II subunit A C-terminal domain phosphatase [Babesia microti strain RI]|uniref:protein-serine/threonine phosphatase n=1 Tax=Babesia microti (strain RI) TaxID=1133968 RepID=A0A1N6LWE9_BABMR|nr:RNA polymerase II subunit A C-terminal domain phosphatase [Babesia microti strain RI]SIO73194.1 RNA polymerase II subunit A C-terminal domain phosphatase [Babesia microti strain RI]|eukprot:XP_021337302.1 RNA polymerase II subunit A C-terminal domain phosphatase [Babesia microti strain RI]